MPMPLTPVIERSWQWVRNDAVLAQGSATATAKALFLRVVLRLTGVAGLPFTSIGSSDSVTAGLDAVNRLSDPTKIVFATSGAHSWLVLGQAATGMQLCWDWNTSSANQATLVVSLAGFTGGSTTARPTASDERVLINAAEWTCASDVQQVLQVLHSVDGMQTMLLICQGGDAKTMVVLGKAVEPVSGWTTPYFAFAAGNSSAGSGNHATEWQRLYQSPGLKSWGPLGAMDFLVSSHSDRVAANASRPSCVDADVVDPLTGKYPAQPMALVSMTSGMRGRHGRLPDLWFVAPSLANGLFPGRPDIAKFGDYLIPWEAGADAPLYA